jgi:hypothetical protein
MFMILWVVVRASWSGVSVQLIVSHSSLVEEMSVFSQWFVIVHWVSCVFSFCSPPVSD